MFPSPSLAVLGDNRAVKPSSGPEQPVVEQTAAELREALSRESEKLIALREIGEALGSTLDLNQLLAVVVKRMSTVMRADRSTLYLLDEEKGELWSKIAQGEETVEIRLPVGDGLAGHVAKSLTALNVKDVYQDPRFDSSWDQHTGYRTRSALCVPMKNQHGRLIGVVQVLNKQAKGGQTDAAGFDADDENLLSALASQAAVSIENSKLFLSIVGKNMELLETKEALERKIRELDVLFEVAHVSASATELHDLLDGLLARTMRAVDAQAAAILVHQVGVGTAGELRVRVSQAGGATTLRTMRVPMDEGICGWVAKHQRSQLVDDVQADERYVPDWLPRLGFQPKSVLSVPLLWEGGEGALNLWNKAGAAVPFAEADRKLATLIAGHVATAIGNAERRDRRAKEERLSSIGQFLSGMLHDLKTPMTVIQGYVRLLATEENPKEREAFALLVRRQIELIKAMTHETLAFARGDRKLLVRKVYLREFFADVVEQLRKEFGEDTVAVELKLSDNGVAYFDPHKIQRAVHNLARNAVEAMRGNGHAGVFEIRVDRSDVGGLSMSFCDNGPGIPHEQQPQLFDAFYSRGKADGTGLGLAIVRQVVEDHDGDVRVTSQPGDTTFVIELPECQPASTSAGELRAPLESDG